MDGRAVGAEGTTLAGSGVFRRSAISKFSTKFVKQ